MNPSEADWRERIGNARRLLEDRLDEEVPLEELAQAAHYSKFHFHRLFRGLTGETVREYSRRLRLERAAHRLTHENDDILRIATDAGYDSHEAFTRAFKKRFDIVPSEFREQRREVHAHRATLLEELPLEVRVERCPLRRIACVRHVGPYDQVAEAWGTLMKWGWSKMMFGKAETFGLCFDDPDITPAQSVRYEACMVIAGKAKAKGDVRFRELSDNTYIVSLHEGSFQSMGITYARLFARIASSPIDGQLWALGELPSIEKYLTDPRKIKPENLRTEIWMPVQ